MILSFDNAKIKFVQKLKEKKYRDAENKFFIEGFHIVEEALKCGASIDYILYSDVTGDEPTNLTKDKNIPSFKVSENIFKKISGVVNPDGIIAVLPKLESRAVRIQDPMIVICDNLQDPGNLGTLIRSSASAGASAVYISEDSADVYNQKVVRSSQGALFHVPLFEFQDIKALLNGLKEENIKIFAADASANKAYFGVNLAGAFAVIIGNEGSGINKEVLPLCDESIAIPMLEGIESLNAAVAASVILFEAARQRLYANKY